MKSKSLLLLLSSFSLLAISQTAFSQTADDVISQYVNVIGGKNNLSKIKSLEVERKAEVGGMKAVINESILTGKGYKQEINLGDIYKATEIYTPKDGFTLNPLLGDNAIDMPDGRYLAGKDKILSPASVFLEYKKLGYKAETIGKEKVGEVAAIKIKMASPDGIITFHFFNTKNHLLIKSTTLQTSLGLKSELVTLYDDYRPVKNIQYPYKLSSNNNASGFFLSSEVIRLEINTTINSSLFNRPVHKAVKNSRPIYDPLYKVTKLACNCEQLGQMKLPNTQIKYAKAESSDNSCRIIAVVKHPPFNDSVTVFLALPQSDWNGRFLGTGGGGFQGGTPTSLGLSVAQGFAVGATDGGHPDASGTFALDKKNNRYDWQAIRNFSHVAIHDMTVLGKAFAEKYYGQRVKYSYFTGGSNGGRQAMEAVQRYPLDYNGVMAGCPAIYWNHFLLGMLWPTAVMNDAKHYVSKEKLIAVTQAVIAAWDDKDGSKDGVINDPFTCTWDPKEFVGTKVSNDMFTEADANVVRRIWEGPRTSRGEFLWYGLTKGTSLVDYAATSGTPLRATANGLSADWVKYFLMKDPNYDVNAVNIEEFEKLFIQSVEQYAYLYQTSNTDLSSFQNNGGKLIITHGVADNLIPPQGSIQYYNKLIKTVGTYQNTSDFARLFLYPGLDHGFMGLAPITNQNDFFEALVKWSEKKDAPKFFNAETQVNPMVKEKKKVKIYPYKGTITEPIKGSH
jgi:hypothetical protein